MRKATNQRKAKPTATATRVPASASLAGRPTGRPVFIYAHDNRAQKGRQWIVYRVFPATNPILPPHPLCGCQNERFAAELCSHLNQLTYPPLKAASEMLA